MKRIIIAVALAGVFISGMFLFTGYPIVFQSSKTTQLSHSYDSSVFNPLGNYKLDEGDWSVYLLIDKSDLEKLTPELKPYKVLKISSVDVLKQMQNTWYFKPTGGDVATVGSSMVVVHNGEMIFKTGVVLDQNMVGLQSKDFGWAEPVDPKKFTEILKEFKEVRSPLIFI